MIMFGNKVFEKCHSVELREHEKCPFRLPNIAVSPFSSKDKQLELCLEKDPTSTEA